MSVGFPSQPAVEQNVLICSALLRFTQERKNSNKISDKTHSATHGSNPQQLFWVVFQMNAHIIPFYLIIPPIKLTVMMLNKDRLSSG